MPVPGITLNAAARRLRDSVINLDDEAWPADAGPQGWDCTLLAERGPLSSNLMLNLARALIVAGLPQIPGNHLVIADGIPLCRALMAQAALPAADVSWANPSGRLGLSDRMSQSWHNVTELAMGLRRRLSFLVRFLHRKWQLAQLRRRYPLPVEALKRSDVLMTVWGRPDTFSPAQTIKREANFGALPALCAEGGIEAAYLSYPLTYTAPYRILAKNAARAKDAVVLVEDLVPWWAGFLAMWSGLGLKARVRKLRALGRDVTAVLKLEVARERLFPAAAEAHLMRFVGRGLAGLGIRPKALLHLYEGQPWEKMLAYGMRRDLKGVRIAGLQHAPFAYEYLSFFPSTRALAGNAVPDLILTSGPGYASWLQAAGFDGRRLAVAGAVRYADVTPMPLPAARSVLCCTGIELQEACELATKAVLATRALGLPLAVNFHPVTDEAFRASVRAAVVRVADESVANAVLSTRPMRELLPEAQIVLYCTSASCFDAVLGGRIAVYVGPDLSVDYDKMPEELALRVRTVEELKDILADTNLAARSKQTPQSLSRWLAPVVSAGQLRELLLPERVPTA